MVARAIELLKKGSVCGQDRKELAGMLFSFVRQLSVEHAQTCAEKVLVDFCPSSEERIAGHCAALELLPQLVAQAGRKCRDYIVDKVCELTWPFSAVVMFAATLVELCETESDCRRAASKISSYIHLPPTSTTPFSSLPSSASRLHVDPEDLPALLYQLTALSSKCSGGGELSTPLAATAVKSLVVDEVSNALDNLLDTFCGGNSGVSAAEGGELSSQLTAPSPSPAETARTRALLSTAIHHLSLLVSKDQVSRTDLYFSLYIASR